MQGVAHRGLPDGWVSPGPVGVVVAAGSVEEDAAVADVPHDPIAGAGGGGEEGEGEVAGERNGVGCRCGGMWRFGGAEGSVRQEAEEGRGVEPAVAPEEGAVGDGAAEGDAGGRGAHEIGCVGDAEKDIHHELAWDRQRIHWEQRGA